MKYNSKNFIAIFAVVLVLLLAACTSSSNESSSAEEDQSQNNSSSQNTNDDSSNVDSTEDIANSDNTDTNNNNTNEKVNTTKNESVKKENSSTNTSVNLKEEYLKKLNDTKSETDKMEATDTSTYSLKKVEDDRWKLWDTLLNEVYGVLNEQLSAEEMDQLRQEQRDWIKFRDDTALEASHKFKGGTQEHLEYSAVAANLTEERCFELVEGYM
ncbi:lysozyme inhibitor LprI family protein [Bacillus sp. JJ1562]|uniref:lysozyme inhibitor LprI family protein n=1 Tax=Bacillus sp. JJ1562 TaxID=3122960 RepID=UPI0030031E35